MFFFCKHFGTGVLIATAFAHLAPTAFLSFHEVNAINKTYMAAPGVIALAGVLIMLALELWMHGKYSHSHGSLHTPEKKYTKHPRATVPLNSTHLLQQSDPQSSSTHDTPDRQTRVDTDSTTSNPTQPPSPPQDTHKQSLDILLLE